MLHKLPAESKVGSRILTRKLATPHKEYLDARKPLVRLVEELGRKRLGHVYIRNGDFTLSAGRIRERGQYTDSTSTSK